MQQWQRAQPPAAASPPGPPALLLHPPPCSHLPAAGTEFEKRILANEANNQKFNFLKDGDPYNAYYRQRVRPGAALLLALLCRLLCSHSLTPMPLLEL